MSTNYRRGYSFELKVRDTLLAQGAVYVCRSAGSHGPVDLIAFYGPGAMFGIRGFVTHFQFVQAKRDGRISKADREALVELARQCGAVPVLAKAGPRGTPVVLRVLEPAGKAAA